MKKQKFQIGKTVTVQIKKDFLEAMPSDFIPTKHLRALLSSQASQLQSQ